LRFRRKETTVPCDFVARKKPPFPAISPQRSYPPLRFRRKKETTVPCDFGRKEATVPCDFVARKKQKMQAPNVKTQKKRS
jgi:hypothetical protein